MRFAVGARVQAALVVLLFLASLAALFFNSVTAFLLPGEEPRARDEAAAAATALADKADTVLGDSLPLPGGASPRLQQRLSDLTATVLSGRPNVEGGFYLDGEHAQFTGGAFPTDSHRPPPGPPHGNPPPGPPHSDQPPGPPHGDPPHGPPPRRDPPPLEAPYIRQQARDCLTRGPDAEPLVQGFDVGPSRVVVATAPVGRDRPAGAAAWAMIRLVGPEQLQAQALRYQVSTGLALAGVLLALFLTATLAGTVRRERQRRERLTDELRRTEHLASLGRLLAGVAHEVRNPLAGIRSTVQLWQRLPDQARTPASLEAVLQAVDRLNGLVGRLLYFARTGWDERRPVDLNAVARETVELLRAQADVQGVRVETDLAADLPATAGSAAALQQVSLNLATNALQAMPKGGVLRLETRAATHPPRVELLVTDTGPGVPPEARGRLFEPFFTTRPDGTGLGLALCREIARQHGGDIGLDEGGESGATFRVTLPAPTEEEGAPS